MKFTIQLLIEDPGKLPLCVPIQTIERECERIEAVDLRLNEAKSLLGQLQQHVVRVQISDYLQAHRCCDQCGQPRRVKGYHPMRFRTALGDLSFRSPRWWRCDCEGADGPASFSPLNQLLTTHTAPDLEY